MKKIFIACVFGIVLMLAAFAIFQNRLAADEQAKSEQMRIQQEQKAAEEETRKADPNYIKQEVEKAIFEKYSVEEFSDILYQSTQNNLGFVDEVTIWQNPDGGDVDLTFELHNLSNTTTQKSIKETTQEIFDIATSVSDYINKVTVNSHSFGGKLTYSESVQKEK